MKKYIIRYLTIIITIVLSFQFTNAQLVPEADPAILEQISKDQAKFSKARPKIDKFFLEIQNKQLLKSDKEKANWALRAADKLRKKDTDTYYKRLVSDYFLSKITAIYFSTYIDEAKTTELIEANFSKLIFLGRPREHKADSPYNEFADLSAAKTIVNGTVPDRDKISIGGQSISVDDPLMVLKRNGDKAFIKPIAILEELERKEFNSETGLREHPAPTSPPKQSFSPGDKIVIFFSDLKSGLSSKENYINGWDFLGVPKE